MLDAVFAGIATQISRALGGPYHDAVVTWPGLPAYDSGGSIFAAGEPVQSDCLAQVDRLTEAQRGAEGYVDGDVAIMILVTSLQGVPTTAARIAVQAGPGAGEYTIQSIERDPLGLAFACVGRPV